VVSRDSLGTDRSLTWLSQQSETEIDVVFLVCDVFRLARQVDDALADNVKEEA